MMKMISSTNITSTRGVTLMSDITSPSSLAADVHGHELAFLACGSGRRVCRPARSRLVHAQTHLRARDQVGMQLMGEVADAFLDPLLRRSSTL